MKTRFFGAGIAVLSIIAITCVAITGCSSSSSSRSDVAAQLVASAKASGVTVDKACVNSVIAKFSAEDFTVIQASAKQDNIDTEALSAAGQALVLDLYNCSGGANGGSLPAAGDLNATQQAVLDQITSSLTAQGLKVDTACLKALISKLDSATIAAQDAAQLAQLGNEAVACVQP